MSQSVLFSGRAGHQAVCFVALVKGLQMICAISAATLVCRYGEKPLAPAGFRQQRRETEETGCEAIREALEDL